MIQQLEVYSPKTPIRIVTSAALFDGHDAAINIMRRILQASGVEVIHLGHNRSVEEVVRAAIQDHIESDNLDHTERYLKYKKRQHAEREELAAQERRGQFHDFTLATESSARHGAAHAARSESMGRHFLPGDAGLAEPPAYLGQLLEAFEELVVVVAARVAERDRPIE